MGRRWRWAALCLSICGITAAAQPRTICAAAGQGRNICVVQAEVREAADGSRLARMHTGSRVVHPGNAFVRADCRTQLVQFLDYRGQPYWEAFFDESAIAGDLGSAMCALQMR